MNRNQWLSKAVQVLRPMFRRIGYPLPAPRLLVVRCEKDNWGVRRWLGLCYPLHIHSNRHTNAFIRINSGIRSVKGRDGVLDTLLHELAHAAANHKLGRRSAHGSCFQAVMRRLPDPMLHPEAFQYLHKRLGKYA